MTLLLVISIIIYGTNMRNHIMGVFDMSDDRCEIAFSDFLEDEIYDQAQELLFQMLRKAFIAGWKAAKEDKIKEDKIIVLPK